MKLTHDKKVDAATNPPFEQCNFAVQFLVNLIFKSLTSKIAFGANNINSSVKICEQSLFNAKTLKSD
jgi:hypothetical protein